LLADGGIRAVFQCVRVAELGHLRVVFRVPARDCLERAVVEVLLDRFAPLRPA